MMGFVEKSFWGWQFLQAEEIPGLGCSHRFHFHCCFDWPVVQDSCRLFAALPLCVEEKVKKEFFKLKKKKKKPWLQKEEKIKFHIKHMIAVFNSPV